MVSIPGRGEGEQGGTQAPHDGVGELVEVPEGHLLQDGQMAGIDVQGRRVLLARVDGEFYAIGGICTHEHAKLEEGALVEHVVFCPLHFSSFDVRSGAVLGPPADCAEPAYPVRLIDGTVYISAQSAEGAVPRVEKGEPENAQEIRVQRPSSWQASLLEKIDSFKWLRRLSDRAAAVTVPVRTRLAPTGLPDLLHGRWLGHALHPALSDLPIGLWGGSLLLYLVDQPGAAAILSLAGIAASLGTIATGVADWTVTDGHERRVGMLHGLLNTGALIIQSGSPAAYFTGANAVAIACSAVSFTVTLGAAHLGGHLVLGRATMVDHTAWLTGPALWTATVRESDLPAGETRTAEVDGRKVLLYRDEGERISAIEDACSHAGAPLSLGQTTGNTVRCPWHGSLFCLHNGAVLRGPATYPQPTLETRVSGGWVEVRALKDGSLFR